MTPGDKALHQVSLLSALKLLAGPLASEWVTSSPASHCLFRVWPVSQTPLEVTIFLTFLPLPPIKEHTAAQGFTLSS